MLPVPEIVKELADNVIDIKEKLISVERLIQTLTKTLIPYGELGNSLAEIKLEVAKIHSDVIFCKDQLRGGF